MRVLYLLTALALASPLQAETWECKAPIERIPWSAADLTVETAETGDAAVRFGSKIYAATYQLDAEIHTWLLSPNTADGFNGGVLRIDSKRNGALRLEMLRNGVVIHTDASFVCRQVEAVSNPG